MKKALILSFFLLIPIAWGLEAEIIQTPLTANVTLRIIPPPPEIGALFPSGFNITLIERINFTIAPERVILFMKPGKWHLNVSVENNENETIVVLANYPRALNPVVWIHPKEKKMITFELYAPEPCAAIRKTLNFLVKRDTFVNRVDIPITIYTTYSGDVPITAEELIEKGRRIEREIWIRRLTYLAYISIGIGVAAFIFYHKYESLKEYVESKFKISI